LSRLIQTYHFPSYGTIPGLPSTRSVDAAHIDNAASDMVDTEIQTTLPNRPRAKTLETLGVALHPLQDSWSHQGEPDIPWACAKLFAFGHPSTRGGWLYHDADLTYLHERPDTVETAQRTYDKLVAFLARHPKMRDHATVEWTKLSPEVLKFAAAWQRASYNRRG
jgi:hypothetical protein